MQAIPCMSQRKEVGMVPSTTVALVTSIGSFAAEVVIDRLHAMGVTVVGCDIYACEWVADSASVDSFHQAPYTSDRQAYQAFLQDVIAAEGVSWILPLTDVDVDFFNSVREEPWLRDVLVLISPKDALDLCRDKRAMAAFLETSGSGVAPIPSATLSELSGMPDLPVVVKPVDGRSSQGLHRVYTPEDWRAVEDIPDKDRYIVQPLIEGSVVPVDVVRGPEGAVAAVPRRELLRTLNGAGTSVHVFHDAELERRCLALADELGVIGCVGFEFMETGTDADPDHEYYFLECNPRFNGGAKFSCMAAYDLVTNHVRAFTGQELDEMRPFRGQYIARRYVEYVMATDD